MRGEPGEGGRVKEGQYRAGLEKLVLKERRKMMGIGQSGADVRTGEWREGTSREGLAEGREESRS